MFEYTGKGFVPTLIDPRPLDDVSSITFLGNETVKKHPVLKEWSVVSSLKNTPHEEIITHQGKYRPSRELALSSAYPIVEGYRDHNALGWHFNFADPAQFHHLYMPVQNRAYLPLT